MVPPRSARQLEDGRDIAKVSSSAEPLYVLPIGVLEPKQPNDFLPSLIKERSEMQELTVQGEAVFDLTNSKTIFQIDTNT